MTGELKTLFFMGIAIASLFIWMDYRDISHDEITNEQCDQLNSQWDRNYRPLVHFADGLDVAMFDCPSPVSGMALGLQFLERTQYAPKSGDRLPDFWQMLIDLKPELGDRAGLRFIGMTTYSSSRIDFSPNLLERGDPVEIAGVLVHELRHLQQGKDTHVPCLRQEQITCDQRLEEDPATGGAYNYSVLFYDSILRKSDANAQARRTASRLLQKVLDTRFNAIKPALREQYEP